MQLLINIDETDKKEIDKLLKGRGLLFLNNAQLIKRAVLAVFHGVPLPKGHGDLVTKEQMIDLVEFYQLNPQHFDFVNLIDEIRDEKPIIEADRSDT